MIHQGPLARYEALVAEGSVTADPAQAAAAAKLQWLHDQLIDYRPPQAKTGWTAKLGFARSKPSNPPKGLYIYGSVGRGKSMLMDLFFDGAQVERKRRVHFHEFMREAHDLIHQWRQENKVSKTAEPIRPTAQKLADSAWLLCFDEFEVRDIADAMIVSRLFFAMFELGVVVVATSNRAPDELYKDGLQRDLFLPFIGILKARHEVFRLDDGEDYRLGRMRGQTVYHVPCGPEADAALDRTFAELTDNAEAKPDSINRKGREIAVPVAASGVARFGFRDLCDVPLAAADFLSVAERFHTVILSDIPILGAGNRDQARRFMTLIDALYDQGVRLVASAEAVPEKLYDGEDWGFEFDRTISRLMEMQSSDYFESRRR